MVTIQWDQLQVLFWAKVFEHTGLLLTELAEMGLLGGVGKWVPTREFMHGVWAQVVGSHVKPGAVLTGVTPLPYAPGINSEEYCREVGDYTRVKQGGGLNWAR